MYTPLENINLTSLVTLNKVLSRIKFLQMNKSINLSKSEDLIAIIKMIYFYSLMTTKAVDIIAKYQFL